MTERKATTMETGIPEHDTAAHRYRLSIDIHSLRGLSENVESIYLRYIYPLLGIVNPVITGPVVSTDNDDHSITEGFAVFEFRAQLSSVRDIFSRDPLIIEFLQKQDGREREIGVVKSSLFSLTEPSTRAQVPNRDVHIIDGYFAVHQTASSSDIAGSQMQQQKMQLRMILTLENHGVDTLPMMNVTAIPAATQSIAPGTAISPVAPQSSITADQYRAMWDLETWRRTEQVKFESRMHEIERERLSQLEAAWKKQELMREEQTAKKQHELSKLQTKLRQALFEVEKEEKRLQNQQEDVVRQKEELKRQFEIEKQEVLLTVKRLREQHKNQISTLETKLAENEKLRANLVTQITSLEIKVRDNTEAYASFRSKSSQSENGKLRLQLDQREAELTQLRAQLERSKTENQDLQAQLGQSVREIARLVSQRQAEEQMRLEKEKSEMQRLRMQYLARDHQTSIARDREELESIKSELAKLAIQAPANSSFDSSSTLA